MSLLYSIKDDELDILTTLEMLNDIWIDIEYLRLLPDMFTENAIIYNEGLNQRIKGIDDIREYYFKPIQKAFPDMKHTFINPIYDDNRISFVFQGIGTHKAEYAGIPATGKILKYDGIAFIKMDEYLIREMLIH